MSLEKEIAKLTAAVEALTAKLDDQGALMPAHYEYKTVVSPPITVTREQAKALGVVLDEEVQPPAPAPESVREYTMVAPTVEEIEAVVERNAMQPEEFETYAEVPPAPPPTLDQVKAAFRALAGRVGDVARNQTLTAELLRTHGGGEPPHLKNVPAENYAALIAAVEAAK